MLTETIPQRARDLPQRLRHETMDLHRAIEAEPAFARLTAPGLTREDYAAHLARLAGFYRPLEAALEVHGAETALDLDLRLVKTGRLRADLEALGRSAAPVPEWPARDLSRLEAAWGFLYVVEGATLGGRLIARRLGPRLELTADAGLSFHLTYGEAAGRMWGAFRRATTEAEADGRLDPDAVIMAARLAFLDFAAWMADAS